MHANTSLWRRAPAAPFPKLDRDLTVDVAVVGGGLTGLTTAVLLARLGKSVALLEAQRLGDGVTGDTSAHLTQMLDTRYLQLEKDFGRAATKDIAASVAGAIATIEELAGDGCGFARVDGLLFTEKRTQRGEAGGELEACLRAGLKATWVQTSALPFRIDCGIRVPGQAQIDVAPYLARLAEEAVVSGVRLFEKTRVAAWEDGEPCTLRTADGRTVTAGDVVLATHSPLNRVFLQTKIAHYQSYVVSGPAKRAPDGLFWDMDDPYHYVRSIDVDGHRQLIVGGEDHKTGQGDPEAAFDRLATYARRFQAVPERRWSHQVVEPCDGLPFIGLDSNCDHVWVATGFSGTGLTFGTLAAQIIAGGIAGVENRYAALYRATRFKPMASMPAFATENVDFPLHLATDPLRPGDVKSVDEVPRGEGRIVRSGAERLAVFRTWEGQVHCLSARCPHLGCHVVFNSAQSTWDCPCHGSRFASTGEVVDGPALSPLPKRPEPK